MRLRQGTTSANSSEIQGRYIPIFSCIRFMLLTMKLYSFVFSLNPVIYYVLVQFQLFCMLI
ncbi:hypothetical protein ACJIZ3_017980 [Penstemon smallii]|uniref:Uncharacterized protein n=1 Tax=Penstemon smallii TaxID=265156 RepID=A0ABD3SXK4_9LAMI